MKYALPILLATAGFLIVVWQAYRGEMRNYKAGYAAGYDQGRRDAEAEILGS